ncbi:MAG: hypothetical protein GMKNLPBB_03035 [Myxococcota bacterium]|nr:hypothetical protein [Myxococcota bacterium]
MFDVDASLDRIPVRPSQIVQVYSSQNMVMIGEGEGGSLARSYMVTVDNGAHGFDEYLYLHYPDIPACHVYRWMAGPVNYQDRVAVEEEGLSFLESMGFAMEIHHLQGKPLEELAELFRSLPFFYSNLEEHRSKYGSIVAHKKASTSQMEVVHPPPAGRHASAAQPVAAAPVEKKPSTKETSGLSGLAVMEDADVESLETDPNREAVGRLLAAF